MLPNYFGYFPVKYFINKIIRLNHIILIFLIVDLKINKVLLISSKILRIMVIKLFWSTCLNLCTLEGFSVPFCIVLG